MDHNPSPPGPAAIMHRVQVQDWPPGREVPPPQTALALDDINLADAATWGREDIHGILHRRREERPIARDEHPSTGAPFWW